MNLNLKKSQRMLVDPRIIFIHTDICIIKLCKIQKPGKNVRFRFPPAFSVLASAFFRIFWWTFRFFDFMRWQPWHIPSLASSRSALHVCMCVKRYTYHLVVATLLILLYRCEMYFIRNWVCFGWIDFLLKITSLTWQASDVMERRECQD